MSADIFIALSQAIAAQSETVRQWHESVPPVMQPPRTDAPHDLLSEVLAQHRCNFELWHIEDEARRLDVRPEVIARCKRDIDAMNQRRNDGMERVDACLMTLLTPYLPAQAANRMNTEPPGMVLDRLSILSLKLWHMSEQLERTDVTATHIAACRTKLDMLTRQRDELAQALRELIQEYLDGTKRPHLYFQCKMYNDPSLNPKLYGTK